MAKTSDRIAEYLIEINRNILFDELSKSYLESIGMADVLVNVPVPVSVEDGGSITTFTIAIGMARVIGADNHFPYKRNYLEYIRRVLGPESSKVLISEGAKYAGSGDYEIAAMLFRCVLLFDKENRDALYLYGRACRDAYGIETEDAAYVGNYKAEALEAFEILTMLHPDFPMGYYFLGYGYANLGLYVKAEITWRQFMELTEGSSDEYGDQREEVDERLGTIADPVRIERACNMIASGDVTGGKEILDSYISTEYGMWWPLWHNIGIAEESLGNADSAITAYKRALQLSPSNTEVMRDLADVYEAIGLSGDAEKYRKKIEIVNSNIEKESTGNE